MKFDPLLYGKQGLERIVGLEVTDNTVDIYTLSQSGEIEHVQKPFKYWLLTDSYIKGATRMEGDLHFKWGKQFSNRFEYFKVRGANKENCYSVFDSKESTMLKDGYAMYLGLKPKDLPILSFDLETTGLDPEAPDARILLISNTFRDFHGNVSRKLFAYDDYESQGAMFKAWSDYVNECDPSIITGHNIYGFDFNYLLSLADRESVSINIGRNGSAAKQEDFKANFRIDGSQSLTYRKIRVYGREVIDTMFLAYRYDTATKKYTSYGLKPIIKIEGLEKQGRTFYDAGKIRFNYKDPIEWQKIKDYCEEDSDDSLALFDLMAPAQFFWTQHVPKGFQQVTESATGSQINGIMVRSYLQNRHSIPKASEAVPFEGAISNGIPGIYSNCIKWDVASLYPSIMLTYKTYDKAKDPKGHFIQMLQSLTTARLQNKKLAKETGDPYYAGLDQSGKIGINSAYGFMGAAGLNFNSPENAALVTRHGRELLEKSILWATGKPYEEWMKLGSLDEKEDETVSV